MADRKLSELTELAAAPAVDDEVYIRDVSEAAADESKRITVTNLLRLTGLTAGELFVATGATTAAWQSTGVVLTAPTLNGTVTLGSTPVFDVGSIHARINTTGGLEGLWIVSTNDGGEGVGLRAFHASTAPVASDILFSLRAAGRDQDTPQNTLNYGIMNFLIEDASANHADGKLELYLLRDQVSTLAMKISSLGVLSPVNSVMFDQNIDSAAVADQVSLGGYEISAGHRALAISSEEVVVTEAIGASDRTLPVRINGATYKIMLVAV